MTVGDVYIRDQQGNYYTVPESDVADAQKAGANVVDPSEVEENKLQTKYGGFGGQATAFGVGAADALTFGLGSGAIGELGDDETKDWIKGTQAANPWSAGIGTAVGAIAPALLTGGESLAGEVPLMARLIPSGEGVLGRVGTGIAKEALIGGARGAGSQISEDILGDTDTTAEKLIAAIGHGALIGGAAGGAFELAGGLGSSALEKLRLRGADIDGIAEKEFGHAAPGVGSAIKAYSNLSSRVSGAAERDIAEQLSPANRELRKLLHDGGAEFQDEAARTIREAGDEMLAANKLVNAEARGEMKTAYVKTAVKKGNEAETAAWANGEIDKMLDGAQATLDAGGGYTKAIEHASTTAYRTKAAIEDAAGSADANAKMFTAVDNMKRDLQKLTRNSYQTLGRMADPIDQRAARLTTEWLDSSAQTFRNGLEDESLWGKAATDQRNINEAWSKQLDAEKRFHGALTTEVGRDPTNPYLQIRGIDPGKASSYVRGIVNPDKDLTHTAVKDYIENTKRLSSEIQKAYDLPPQTLAEVAKLNQAAGKFNTQIFQAEKALTFINQFNALKGHSGSGVLGAVGGIVGGPVGAGLGLAADALGNPAKQVQRLASLERFQEKINARIEGMGGVFSGRRSMVNPHSFEVTPSRASFEASAANVQQLAQSSEMFGARIARSLEHIAGAAPKIATAVSMRSQAMMQFLAAHLPPGMQPQDGVLNTKWAKPSYSDAEMRDWQQLAAALHDPLSTIEKGLKSGSLSSAETGAIKQFYPKMFGEVVASINKEIAEMKDPPSREKRLTLSVLFDIPTDEDLSPDVTSVLASLYNTPAPSEGGGPSQGGRGGPKQMDLKVASSLLTPSQAVETGKD